MTTIHHPQTVELADLLDEWTREGLISATQATALRQDPHPRVALAGPSTNRARSVALEGLGYLGGAIVVAAGVTLAAQYWADLGSAARVLVAATAWTALAMAATLVRPDGGARAAAVSRLRAVLWLASTGAAAAFLSVLGDSVLQLRDADLAVLAGWGTTAYAAVVWWRWRTPLQQTATLVALAAAAAALLAQQTTADELPGIGVWAVGVGWALLAWRRHTVPQRLGLVGGPVIAVFGAMTTASSDAGTTLVIATLAMVMALGVWSRDPALLAVAALGIVLNVPVAVQRWFPGSLTAPAVLLVTGLAVVGLAVVMTRHARSAERATALSHAQEEN